MPRGERSPSGGPARRAALPRGRRRPARRKTRRPGPGRSPAGGERVAGGGLLLAAPGRVAVRQAASRLRHGNRGPARGSRWHPDVHRAASVAACRRAVASARKVRSAWRKIRGRLDVEDAVGGGWTAGRRWAEPADLNRRIFGARRSWRRTDRPRAEGTAERRRAYLPLGPPACRAVPAPLSARTEEHLARTKAHFGADRGGLLESRTPRRGRSAPTRPLGSGGRRRHRHAEMSRPYYGNKARIPPVNVCFQIIA